MTPDAILALVREGLWLVLLISAPPLAGAAIMTWIGGLLQRATNVQDPALGYAPRLAGVVIALAATAPWIHEHLVAFTTVLFSSVGHP